MRKVRPRRSGRIARGVRCGVGIGGPAKRFTELCSGRERGCVHDFEVLFVLRRSACGYFIEPLAKMGFSNAAEAAEGGEELIVPADARAGNEAAHGEGIDKLVVEM